MKSKSKPGPKRVVQDPVIKSVQLERSTLEDLEEIAEGQGFSANALIREVLTEYAFAQLKQ